MIPPWEWLSLWRQLSSEEQFFVKFLCVFLGIIILLEVFLLRCRKRNKELIKRCSELTKTPTLSDSPPKCQQTQQKQPGE